MSLNTELYRVAGYSLREMNNLQCFLAFYEDIHWITLNHETGIYELTLDNQIFSTFRACPAHFIELYVRGLTLKGTGGRSWYLEFGILFHKMIELYYKTFRTPGFILQEWAVNTGIEEWNKQNLDFFSDHKEYKLIGGRMGFIGLLIAYAERFSAENERIRVIGTEISFGKAHEVSLGFGKANNTRYLEVFLSGRMDLLVDDGNSIAPMDHKTMASFRNDPTLKFELDEGPCGYIYAVNQILPTFLKEHNLEHLINRSCNKIIMNFISKSIPKEGERFKRIPILKSTEQLESYRLRMLDTAEDIFKCLVRYVDNGIVYRNTSACTNWYMHDCTYLPIHRQNSKANELIMIDAMYEKKTIWNTENVGGE